jgi:hypothetical protein
MLFALINGKPPFRAPWLQQKPVRAFDIRATGYAKNALPSHIAQLYTNQHSNK